ncbi:hypothetical protein RIF29_25395 [Crotalaria pallida]|uniref:Uncharacterized protein n=1 Tax=Crotalaria pallida TaxID=3830 RepID=A0AAN9I465_CROPI
MKLPLSLVGFPSSATCAGERKHIEIRRETSKRESPIRIRADVASVFAGATDKSHSSPHRFGRSTPVNAVTKNHPSEASPPADQISSPEKTTKPNKEDKDTHSTTSYDLLCAVTLRTLCYRLSLLIY